MIASNKTKYLFIILGIILVYTLSYSLLNFLAWKYYSLRNYPRAEKYYLIVKTLNPFAKRAYAQLGYIELLKNENISIALRNLKPADTSQDFINTFTKVIKYNERAIKLGLNEAWVYRNTAVAYDNLYVIASRVNPQSADPSKAIFYYEKAVTLDPSNPDYHDGLGSIYYQEKKYDLAIEHLKIVSEKKSNDGRIRALIGFSYIKLEDFNSAIKYLKETVALNYQGYTFPDQIHEGLGFCYVRLGKLNYAIREFDKTISLNSQSATSYFYRGLSYFFKGSSSNLLKAKEDFNKYLELAPTGPLVSMAREYLKQITK